MRTRFLPSLSLFTAYVAAQNYTNATRPGIIHLTPTQVNETRNSTDATRPSIVHLTPHQVNGNQSSVLYVPSKQEIDDFSKMSSDPSWIDPTLPSNEEVCKLVNSDPQKAASEGGVAAFMDKWFTKNNGNMGMYTLEILLPHVALLTTS
jgi:hypothetical protein